MFQTIARTSLCGLMLVLACASAQEAMACKPQKIIRYLDVDIAVEPPSGAPGRDVTLSADCLPADRPVTIWSGPAFDSVLPVGGGATDSAGHLAASASVPASAEPAKSYYFAVMMESHVVGTGAFQVEGEPPANTQ
jgi:hypothetical protein